jgi:hypothetical protein
MLPVPSALLAHGPVVVTWRRASPVDLASPVLLAASAQGTATHWNSALPEQVRYYLLSFFLGSL